MPDMATPPIRVNSIEDLPETKVIEPGWFFRIINPLLPKGDRTKKVTPETLSLYFAGQKGDQGIQGPPGTANIRTARVPIGTGLLAANAIQALNVAWTAPFDDAKYTLSFGWQRPAGISLSGVQVAIVGEPTKTGVTLNVVNGLISLSMTNVILHVTATHDN